MKKLLLLLSFTPLVLSSQFIKVEDFIFKPPFKEIKESVRLMDANAAAMDAKVDANREKVSFYMDNIIIYSNERKLNKEFFNSDQYDYIITTFDWAKKYYSDYNSMTNNENARIIITGLKKLNSLMQNFKCTEEKCYSVNLSY